MRSSLFAIMLIAAFSVAGSLQAESPKQNEATSGDARSSKKDAVHLVPHSSAEMKQIFTYFPYPELPSQYRFSKISGEGHYRLTLDPQGNVTEIKILKRMGVFGNWPADVDILKTLIRWRANPGPVRIVDVPWRINPGHQYITNEGSHIPRR
jgi:hypothetical protein